VNLNITQKNGFHYHNLVFMLNQILEITHVSGGVHVVIFCLYIWETLAFFPRWESMENVKHGDGTGRSRYLGIRVLGKGTNEVQEEGMYRDW